MPGVARATHDHMTCSPLNIISDGSSNVFVNSKPVAYVTSNTPGHPGGGASTMVSGNSNNVFANGKSICVLGSQNAPHGGGPHGPVPPTIATASTDVFIG